jgi:hypothetical protein
MKRRPLAGFLLAVLILSLHILLCYPAATRRGYPPIHPFWMGPALCLGLLAVPFFPLFDDRPSVRWPLRISFILVFCSMLGIVATNGRVTPSLGHLAGVAGILQYDFERVVGNTISQLIALAPVMLAIEYVSAVLWARWRQFADAGNKKFAVSVRLLDLSIGVTLITLLLGSVALVSGYQHHARSYGWFQNKMHLRELGLAMHEYAGVHGRFPPAVLYSKDGKPLHSWRVLLLPYLDEDLYKQFNLEEPWDSPHNIKLLPRIPDVYRYVRRDGPTPPRNHTYYHVFVGKGTPFEGTTGIPIEDFPDGRSETILIVEGGEPVPWTKPEDIPFTEDHPFAKIATVSPYGFESVFADGALHFIQNQVNESTIRALITRNGGEKVDSQDY